MWDWIYQTPQFNQYRYGQADSGNQGFWGQLSSVPGGIPGLALNAGSELFGLLSNVFGGAGKKKKDLYRQLGNLANIGQGQIGKPIYDVKDVEAESIVRATPRLQEQGRMIDKRFGFDQGAAGKQYGQMFSDFLGQLIPGLRTREAELRSSRDTNLLGLIANIRNSQAGLI